MDDFDIECSDDEFKHVKGPWEPPIEDVIRIYEQLDEDHVPELNWQCPGYRAPSPNIQESEISPAEAPAIIENKSDFDFMDEVSAPKLKIRRDGEDLKGSAKKKTTSLDGVISSMRKHNLLPAEPVSETQQKPDS